MIIYDGSRSSINDYFPDIAPLLDVLFILIMFLLLTANTPNFHIKVNLPKDEHSISKPLKEKSIKVTILPESKGWMIDSEIFKDKKSFENRIVKQINNNKAVSINADKDVNIQKLVYLLTLFNKYGIDTSNIIIKR